VSVRTGASGQTIALSTAAMVAFAANSLLCRMALGNGLIDPAGFTAIRMISGAAMLALIVLIRTRPARMPVSLPGVAALSAYMVFFSFAYVSLNAGMGALLLFGAVQLSMFTAAVLQGERPGLRGCSGLLVAMAGLIVLVAPGFGAPDPAGAVMMALAGIAWGIYSLTGRTARRPLIATAGNFLWSVPVAIAVAAGFFRDLEISAAGVAFAVASGTIASALGYAIWYAALARLAAVQASIIQLSVPVIATLGGVVLLDEVLTSRIVLATVLTLGGILAVLIRPRVR